MKTLNRRIQGLVLLMLLGSLPAVKADSLQAVMNLARAGARHLALQEMDARQPDFATDPVGWIRWEQERLYILQLEQDWHGILERLEQAPEGIPASLAQAFVTRRAEAQLELGHADTARQLLREHLWQDPADIPAETRQQWRRLLIRSYMQAGAVSDAQLAMLRYQQDFSDTSPEWYLLGSRVLLRSGRPGQALTLLQGVDEARILPYRWLARLRSDPDAAAAVAADIDKALKQSDDMEPDALARLWAVRAQAEARQQAFRQQTEALESGLAQGERVDPALFELTGDVLWGAYLAWGTQLGNDKQMLIGQDERWYFAATEAMESDPLQARALFAVLAMQGQSGSRRNLGHEYLAKLVLKQAGGGHLLYALYLNNSQFPRIDDIPAAVRYLLVDVALSQQDLTTASRLLQGLAAPSDSERFAWQLQRARVLILTGQIQTGAELLTGLLADQETWKPGSLDRFLQVIFDLQRMDEHEQAITLLKRIDPAGLELQPHRELLFWLAESYAALDRQRLAAVYFLQSAILADPYAMDPWAQTARYHAAQSLGAAGLQGDAANLIEGLLKVTRDPNRRAVLRHELQQLEAGRHADK